MPPTVPLKIDRTKLLTQLDVRAKEEQAKREAATTAATKRRKAAQDAVSSLSADEVLNLVIKHINGDLDDIVDMVAEAKETGRLKTPETKETPTETAIQKWIRVFGMSNDQEILVAATDDLYALL